MKALPRVAASIGVAAVLGAASVGVNAELLGPTPYAKFSDSPFASVPNLVVRDFEDGNTSFPGVTFSTGWIHSGPSIYSDSVDADDGVLDGSGLAGSALYSGNSQYVLTVTFDAAGLGGALPTHVGIVWTDVGNVWSGTTGYGEVHFAAKDGSDATLVSTAWIPVGDGNAQGGTAEDRFFGVTNAGGVKSITLTMYNSYDWEVDHLQYTTAPVPEPGTWALGAAGGLLLAGRLGARRGRKAAN